MSPVESSVLVKVESTSNSTCAKATSHHQGRSWLNPTSEIQNPVMSEFSQTLASGHLITPVISSSSSLPVKKPLKLTLCTYNSERDRGAIEAIIAQNESGITGLDINCIEKNKDGFKEKSKTLPNELQELFDSSLFDAIFGYMNSNKTEVLRINDEQTIGFLTYSLLDNNSTVSIDQIAIHESYQRKHYGKYLLSLIIKKLKADHNIQVAYVTVSTENRVASIFYASVGFSPDKHRTGLPAILLKKTV